MADARPSQAEYLWGDDNCEGGAFSCWLCRHTINGELKLMKNKKMAEKIHFEVHVARFFNSLFKSSEVRGAFYEFARREMAMLDLMSGG